MRLFDAIQGVNDIIRSNIVHGIIIVGDVVHDGLRMLLEKDGFGVSKKGVKKLFSMKVNGYAIASKLLKMIDVSLRASRILYVWGNHDNLMTCGAPEASGGTLLSESIANTHGVF